MGTHGDSESAQRSLLHNPWVQLAAGILGMIAVANFQYAWTVFVRPIEAKRGWSRESILDALNLYFVVSQTWLVPLEGYLAERFGPRRLMFLGGILAGSAWVINAYAPSLAVLNAAQVMSGVGSGIVYSISVGNALKWFPTRRGLAAGLTAAAFGAGSAATILPIRWTIYRIDYPTAFLWFGIGQGLVVIAAGLFMRFPSPHAINAANVANGTDSGRDQTPWQMLRQPVFWLLYGMMTLGAIPGLLMLGQLEPMAYDFGVAETELFHWGTEPMLALPAALMLDRITGGLTRPIFGWLSDIIGREWAIFFAFGLEGLALLVLIQFPHNPYLFVLMTGLAFFGWGAVFSLFPAVSADLFGPRFAATNYGLLYTAKGTASLLVIGLNRIRVTEGWPLVLALMIAADWLAALLAILVLKPLASRFLACESRSEAKA